MSHTPLTPVQALNLLGQAAATFVGTRADHEKLEQAFKVLEPLVAPAMPSAASATPASSSSASPALVAEPAADSAAIY